MALFHFTAQVIGRSTGRSAPGAAAYRAGERIIDERTGLIFDYSRKRGVEHREIIAPDNAPAWMLNREQLWNAVERAEVRKDAQLCREVEVALPCELTREQRLDLLRSFVREEFVGRGMVADICVHNPRGADGLERPHSHIMLTMRELAGEGFGKKNRGWNGKDLLEDWRERWASHVNCALERHGHRDRVDHRSLEAQRADALQRAADPDRDHIERGVAELIAESLDREPQPKLGRAAAFERRGIKSDRGNQGRQVQERNAERSRLREKLREIRGQASRLIAQGCDVLLEHVNRLSRVALAALLTQTKPSLDVVLGRTAPEAKGTQAKPSLDALLGRSASEGKRAPVVSDAYAWQVRGELEREDEGFDR